jgi:glycosyltransferase involved in cell wall biosynthesis
MKIAIATDAWPPQISGVVTTLKSTIKELELLGHEVRPIHPECFSVTVPCPTYPQIRLALAYRTGFGRHFKSFAPDSVHIVTEGPIGMACRQFCRKEGLKFTTSFTTRFDEYVQLRFGIPSRAVFRMLRWFHCAASNVMVSSVPLKKELDEKGFANTVLWPRGVDTDLFKLGDKPFITDPRPIFLYVGRVAVEKNIESFLALDLPGTQYVVGDGPSMEKLKARYPKVRFVGAKHGEELARYYGASDVFVFPSLTDTFGIVMLEAMACGLPVAGYPVRGPVDIVQNGVTGFLDQDLRTAALKALEIDPQACRRFARQYSWQKSARRFVENLVSV